MQRICLSVFIIAIIASNVFGQQKPSVFLTNYTYSPNQPFTVFIKSMDDRQIQAISIEGEQAKGFAINKSRRLTVSKSKMLQNEKWFDVVLNVKTSKGRFKDTIRLVKDEFIRNKVIAHRGAWKNTGATENSIAALTNAIKMGCEGSEFDVHMSSDSVMFIHHDPGVEGTSIAKSPASLLTSIKLSNGENLPTLESYLKAGINQNKTKLILEIKASELGKESSLALTRKVVALVENLRAQAWVDYISFDYDVCTEVKQLAPYAKVAYLLGDKSPAEIAKDSLFGVDYHFTIFQKNPDWIKEAKEKNLTVNVWTVNDKPVMEDLLKQDVDFITTNEPEMLLEMVGKK